MPNISDIAQKVIPILPFGGLMLYFLKRMLTRADKIDEEERAELLALRKEERELFNQVSEKLGTIFPLLYSAVVSEDRRPKISKKGFDRREIIKDTAEITKELRSSLVEIEAKNKAYSGNKIFSVKYRKIIDELDSIHRTIEAVIVIDKNIENELKIIYKDVKEGIDDLKKGWKFSSPEKEDKDTKSIEKIYEKHNQKKVTKEEIYELCQLRLTCILYRYRDLPDYIENKKRTEYEDSMISKYIGDKESYIVKERILKKFDAFGVDKIICSWRNWRGLGNIFYLLYFKVYWLMFLIIAIYIPIYALMHKYEINYWWYLIPLLLGSVFVYLLGEYFLYKNYVKTKKYIERKVQKYKDREKAMRYIGERRWFNSPIIASILIIAIFCIGKLLWLMTEK